MHPDGLQPGLTWKMAQQLAFFPQERRTIAQTASGMILYIPGVFSVEEAAHYFERLLQVVPWSRDRMRMYEKLVEVPRLVASYREPEAFPAELDAIRERVRAELQAPFNAIGLNYYRDGRDSVAWHSDHDEDLIDNPIVALVSLGATREMWFRTKTAPRVQQRCDLEPGSVLAMCGDVQDFWEHHIPKVNRPTQARISVALRTKVTTGTRP